MAIKTIIFDLGGVIIDIDYNKTSEAFRRHGAFNFDVVYSQSKQDSLFDNFDIGKISAMEFRKLLQAKLGISISDSDFDSAWNAMLLDLPIERLNFIESLKNDYSVFLFSNTNEIHIKEVFNICQAQNGFNNFNSYFNREYYSHTFGMRKPNIEAFLAIIHENELNPNETLFIDDSLQHVLGAREAGLHAMHLTKGMNITAVLDYIKSLREEESIPSVTHAHTM